MNSWFHLTILLLGYGIMFTWPMDLDKQIGLSFWTVVLIVLTIGKVKYYLQNVHDK